MKNRVQVRVLPALNALDQVSAWDPQVQDVMEALRGAQAQLDDAAHSLNAYLGDDGKPSASAYMIDQSRELGQLDLMFGQVRTYQRSVIQIEQLTGIRFANLADYDGFSNEERATGTRIEALIQGPEDIRV